MRRIATLAVAVALLGGAGAATASAEQAGTQACHTWQYKIKFTTPVKDDRGIRIFWAYQGNKFNTQEPFGDRYPGDVYQNDNTYRGTGSVHTDALDYTTCW